MVARYLFIAAAVMVLTPVAVKADDDRDGFFRGYTAENDDFENDSLYESPFDKPKDRGPFYETRIHKEDRIKTLNSQRGQDLDPLERRNSRYLSDTVRDQLKSR